MKKTILIILQFSFCYSGLSQINATYELLDSITKKHTLTTNKNLKIYGNGVHRNDKHLTNRNRLNEYDMSYSFTYQSNAILFSANYIENSHSKAYSNKMCYSEGEEYIYNSKKEAYSKTHPNNTIANTLRTFYLNPSLLLHYIKNNKDKLAMSYKKSKMGYQLEIQFANAEKWVLAVSNDYTCQHFSYESFDYLYGDVVEKIVWQDYAGGSFGIVPQRVLIKKDGYEAYNLTQKISEALQKIEFDAFSEVKTRKEKKKKDRVISLDSISIKKVTTGLFEIQLSETNNRLLLAEFENFLMLLEGSYHSKNGDLLINTIKKRFPNKPIKFASFSHCHTQYMGMSRSYAAHGIRIITTNDNFNFIDKLAAASFSKRPDIQEINPKKPIYEVITDSWVYEDNYNSIKIYNIESNHTDNYLVYYFPKHKTLFAGDMLWISNKHPKPISGRSLILYNEVVTRLNLDVDTYITSWPLAYYGVKNVVLRDEVMLEN